MSFTKSDHILVPLDTSLISFNDSVSNTAQVTVPVPNTSNPTVSTLLPVQDDNFRRARLKQICDRHEICDLFAQKLQQLEGFEIIIIADDSGSMNTPAGSVVVAGVGNPYGAAPTRWDELKRTSGIIIDIASTMATHGVDIYFLNRAPVFGVITHEQLDNIFNVKPSGPTPIVPILKKIFMHPPKHGKKRLVLLMTDGKPTAQDGRSDDTVAFKRCLLYDRQTYDYVNIIACTDDDATMEYLNNWDDTIPRLDVIDDYGSEYNEVKTAQGKNFSFSYGDYVVKSMLGSIDPWFDHLDEVNLATGIRVYRGDSCCVLL